MKKLFLLATAITSISNGIAAERVPNKVITVYAEDLIGDEYKKHSYCDEQLLKRYSDAEEFSKYVQTKWRSIMVITAARRLKPVGIQLDKVVQIGNKDNHPDKLLEVNLIVTGRIDGKPVIIGPKFITKMNIFAEAFSFMTIFKFTFFRATS